MLTFLRTRAYVLAALTLTLTALILLLTRESLDAEWMWRWNQIAIAHVKHIYIVIIAVLLLALPFATRIWTTLQRRRGFIVPLIPIACFVIMRLLEPNQEHRLFITPFSIWVIITHVLALAALIVFVTMLADGQVQPPASAINFQSLSRHVLLVIFLVLAFLYIVSISEFMPLDIPDEPWLGSAATNYAENHDLSPSFIGSPYGSHDPVVSRYYVFMGLWARSVGSSLMSLRAFPLLILAGMGVLVGYILFRNPSVTLTQSLFGMVTFLSLSPVMRTSHNLRPDIGLGLYGVVMLWGMLEIFSHEKLRSRLALVLGLALYLGLEAIPFVALPLAFITGVLLIIWLIRHRTWRTNWQPVFFYAVSCGLMLMFYVGVHLLPDVQAALHGYQQFNSVYASETGFGQLHLPIDALLTYHLRFSLILSPAEFLASLAVLLLLWHQGTVAERWTLLCFGVALLFMLFVVRFSFGYWVLFAPLVVYAVVRALRSPWIWTIGCLVVLPAMVAAPVYDLVAAIQTQPNQIRLQALDALTPLFPSGITMIGDDIFWFNLHTQRTFVGVSGFWMYFSSYNGTVEEAIRTLGVDAIICRQGDDHCAEIVNAGDFGQPSLHTVADSVYMVYWQTEDQYQHQYLIP